MLWLLLLIGALLLWFTRRRKPQIAPPAPVKPGRQSRPTSIEVECITVTPERQEWRSLKTGRRYDVTSARGLTGAKEGDRAVIAMGERGWHIRTKPDLGQ